MLKANQKLFKYDIPCFYYFNYNVYIAHACTLYMYKYKQVNDNDSFK